MARMTRMIISLPNDEKDWLETHGRKHRISGAEIMRRALREYREARSGKDLAGVLEDTAGTWASVKGDSQAYVDALRREWGQRK